MDRNEGISPRWGRVGNFVAVTASPPSMQYHERIIRLGVDCGEAPDGDRLIGAAAGAGGFSLLVEHLPGERPALLPAGPFRPDEYRFAFAIHGQRRVLAAARRSGRGDRPRAELVFLIDPREKDLPVGFPGA